MDFEQIKPIARNLDKFTGFTIGNLAFRDSREFLIGALAFLSEQLFKSLKTNEDKMAKFWMVMEEFGIISAEDPRFIHMMAKGVYPYEYMDSEDRMEEKELPPREAFWSNLTNKMPKQKHYARALWMFDVFGCRNLAEYTLLYVKLDVLLLATLMELFRISALAEGSYGIDPAHFLTAPSFSWSAMLFMNYKKGVVIENMTDVNMLLMTKRGIRGGMCQVGAAGIC